MSSRDIDSTPLTLSASGWTYLTRFVLYDYETESLWFPFTETPGLTCISGFYADRHLQEFPSTLTEWFNWKAENHDTKYMKYPQ